MTPIDKTVLEELKKPFIGRFLSVKPGATTQDKTSGMVLTYIDARAVMDRLDDCVGPDGWNFRWEPTVSFQNSDGVTNLAVKGILKIGDVIREDVGEALAESEPYKSAVSDALKRCAVHFGIGRYLYDMPSIWWPLKNKRFEDYENLVQLMAELSEKVYEAGGDASKVDLKKYKHSGTSGTSTPRTGSTPRAGASSGSPSGAGRSTNPSGGSSAGTGNGKASEAQCNFVNRLLGKFHGNKEAQEKYITSVIGRCPPITPFDLGKAEAHNLIEQLQALDESTIASLTGQASLGSADSGYDPASDPFADE